MVEPRQIINVLRDIEAALQRFSGISTVKLRQIEQEIFGWERTLQQRQTEVEAELYQARAALQACLNSGYVDKDGNYHPPDCSAHEQAVYEIEQILTQLRRLSEALASAARQYRAQASSLQSALEGKVPAACYQLRDHEAALEKFEQTQSALGSIMPAIISVAASLGGGHGSQYQAARQQFLRNLQDDPNQPKYVRGWIRQELNRLEQVKQARQSGTIPPGGNRQRIRGVPGLDVGHRYPDIDLPENFRLEDAWTNRSRPARARKLGLSDWIR